MRRFLLATLAAVSLSACASMFGNATQEITVLTPGAYETECQIDNGAVLYRTRPPQTITISRRSYPLEITCLADGNRQKTVIVESEPEPIALANFGNGFAPGMFIDHDTGALYTFPPIVTVDFSDMPAQHMPRPGYDLHLADNPELFGMEEFRPGDAALSRDKYETGYVLKKRERPASSEFVSTVVGTAATGDAAAPAAETTEDLTRSMNPTVFDPTPNDQVTAPEQDFIGGTSPESGQDEPVTLYPLK